MAKNWRVPRGGSFATIRHLRFRQGRTGTTASVYAEYNSGARMSYRHGTQYAYRIKGCKCEDCQAWKAKDVRQYRRNRIARGWRMVHGKWVTAQDSQLPS